MTTCTNHTAARTDIRPFITTIAGNHAADGGVCELQTCRCGHIRNVNRNGLHVAATSWHRATPGQDSARANHGSLSRLDWATLTPSAAPAPIDVVVDGHRFSVAMQDGEIVTVTDDEATLEQHRAAVDAAPKMWRAHADLHRGWTQDQATA